MESLVAEQATSQAKKSRRRGRSASSESSSSDSSTVRRKDRKAKKKDKKNRHSQRGELAAASTGLGDSKRRCQELQEFRRRAEIEKIREEVKAGLAPNLVQTAARPSGHADVKPGTYTVARDRAQSAAETRLLCAELVPSDASTWDEVSEQLSAQPLPEIKKLLQQLPHCALPHGRIAETV